MKNQLNVLGMLVMLALAGFPAMAAATTANPDKVVAGEPCGTEALGGVLGEMRINQNKSDVLTCLRTEENVDCSASLNCIWKGKSNLTCKAVEILGNNNAASYKRKSIGSVTGQQICDAAYTGSTCAAVASKNNLNTITCNSAHPISTGTNPFNSYVTCCY